MKVKLAVMPKSEWGSVLRGACLAGAGVGLTYFVQHISATDFGPYGFLVVGAMSVVANILRKCVDMSGE